jgi:hypothetical protein
MIYEAIGLSGSLLVAISLMMKNIKTLRIINFCGSLAFGIYGLLIGSLSVTLLNLFTVCVNVFYLYRLHKENDHPQTFDILFKNPLTDEYLKRFILFHGQDIKRFFPSFNPDPVKGSLVGAECSFILRETLPVSLIAFKRKKNGEISIILDYAIPAYRDLKNGKFFFETAVSRIAEPGTVFTAQGEVPAHAAYLRKLGFEENYQDEKSTGFRKEIKI